MKTYIYCADDAATQGTPVRALTPRCWFRAENRREALRVLREEILPARPYRGYGKAGVRQETAREHNHVADLCDTLPSVAEYLDSMPC
jgi:hypothetical protein